MSWKERVHLIDSLWSVLELLQRVNMLGDVDREEFVENNRQCNNIKAMIRLLNQGDVGVLEEARELVEEYLGTPSEEEAV